MGIVGTSVPRVDGPAKVAGAARYVDDLTLPGMLHGRTIRATIPSGLVTGVRLGFDPAGFTVVDWHDVPGRNRILHVTDDQPCLVEREVRHQAEPVLLLAHADPEALLRAGLVKEITHGVKVLGTGDVPRPLTVRAHAFSASAREKILAAGGKVAGHHCVASPLEMVEPQDIAGYQARKEKLPRREVTQRRNPAEK